MVVSLAAIGCKKSPNTEEELPISKAGKFGEIKTSPSFDWGTSKSFNLKVIGLSTTNEIRNTFKVTSLDKSATYHQSSRLMSESFTTTLTIPTYLDSLSFQFGSVTKNFSVKGTEIEVDYLINYPEEIL